MELTPFTPLKLLRHTDRVEAMLAGELTFPISVELDLSNRCPHDCPFCSFGTNESQGYRQTNWVLFPEPRALTLIDELVDCGVQSVTLTGGGEPLVHRGVIAIMQKLTASPLQWGLVTNGLLLTGEIADAVADGATFCRISLDAGSTETHAFTHGVLAIQAQYPKILQNIRDLRQAALAHAHPLTIGASFCVMDENLKEIYRAAKDVKDAGADYLEVRPTFPTDWRGDGWGHALSNAEAAQIETEHARLHLNSQTFQVIGMTERFDSIVEDHRPYTKCRIGPLMTVIGATGELWHCCVQRGRPFFKIGEVLTKGFREAWTDAQERKMADEIDVTKCPRCRYQGYLQLIEEAFIQDRMHANFV